MSSSGQNRWVVLDDNDPIISYLGSWSLRQDNFGEIWQDGLPYRHTLHGIGSSGTLTLNFTGTRIAVWGAGANPLALGWACSVDGREYELAPVSELSTAGPRQLCNIQDLDDGAHVFNISIRSTVQNSSTFWLDRVAYGPYAFGPLPNGAVIVEPSDSAIRYDSSWEVPVLEGGAFQTARVGGSVNVLFNGTSVSWYAKIPMSLLETISTGSYVVDGEKPTQFVWSSTEGTRQSQNHLLFTTPPIGYGEHSLTVTFLGSSKLLPSPLVLDHLVLYNETAPPSLPPYSKPIGVNSTLTVESSQSTKSHSSISSTDSATSSHSTGLSGNTSIVTPSQPISGSSTSQTLSTNITPTSSSSSQPKSNLGAILGGLFGGLAVFIFIPIVFLLVWRYYRRRPRVQVRRSNSSHTPFVLCESTECSMVQSSPVVAQLRERSGEPRVGPMPRRSLESRRGMVIGRVRKGRRREHRSMDFEDRPPIYSPI